MARWPSTSAARAAPPLPVDPALLPLLPGGLRRGSTVAVGGSISLLLALLGHRLGRRRVVRPRRLSAHQRRGGARVRGRAVPAGRRAAPGESWTTAVGALLDAVDVVAARPPRRLVPGDVRRLGARVRARDAVLVPFGDWPSADVRLSAEAGEWSGIGAGTRAVARAPGDVTATGRGQAARPRSAELWLPSDAGGVRAHEPLAPVVELAG